MAERDQTRQPSHRAYPVIRREGQDDYWLNIDLVFPHKDETGFNIMLQASPLDGKIVYRELVDEDEPDPPTARQDNDRQSGRTGRADRRGRR